MTSDNSTSFRAPAFLTSTAAAVLFLFAAALAPASAVAASHAAKIIYAIGDVSATDASGSRRSVKRGDFIASGDTVVTGKGRAQLKLTDGSFIALNPQTEYAFEDYSYDDAAPSRSRSFFNLVRGGVRLVTGAIARSNRSGWRLRTSVATIGIRGSGGYFRYLTPDSLRINVDFGGFTATDPDTGLESDLGPGEYICNSPCLPVDGAGDQEDLTYYDPEEEQRDFENRRGTAGNRRRTDSRGSGAGWHPHQRCVSLHRHRDESQQPGGRRGNGRYVEYRDLRLTGFFRVVHGVPV